MFEGLKPDHYNEVLLKGYKPVDLDRLYALHMVRARVYMLTASIMAVGVYAYLVMSVITGSAIAFGCGIPLTIFLVRYCYRARAAVERACDLAQLCDLEGKDC